MSLNWNFADNYQIRSSKQNLGEIQSQSDCVCVFSAQATETNEAEKAEKKTKGKTERVDKTADRLLDLRILQYVRLRLDWNMSVRGVLISFNLVRLDWNGSVRGYWSVTVNS